jgi:hypothetical protein
MSKVMFVPLYLAMRDGDDISLVDMPHGTANSVGGKHQCTRARLLLRQRLKVWNANEQHGLAPTLDRCFPSWNLRCHFAQILRFCIALNGLDSHSILPTQITTCQSLLQMVCMEYTRMNIPLSPNFHYMMHLEESMCKDPAVT